MTSPRVGGIHVFARDVDASAAFYRLLGFSIDGGGDFARASSENGDGTIEIGSHRLSRGYDDQFREPSGGVPACAIQLHLESREAVDELYAKAIAAGYQSSRPPFDAFWGSRYAEIDDPDGNIVGLQSPRDPARVAPTPL